MRISVVIPAYNAERTVGRAIDSVLAQTRAADEVIVVDDGSTDGTADVVRRYGEKVTLICQENAGVSVARNRGIEASTGEWIAFLDGDDEWRVEKLQLQTGHLSRNPEIKWTYSNFYKQDGSAPQTKAHVSSRLTALLDCTEVFDDYLTIYANHGYAWTGTLIVHRDVFATVGMFEPGMKRAQDTDLWFRIAYQFPQVGYIAEPLAIYHQDTPGSSIKVNDRADFAIALIDRHMELSSRHGRQDAFRWCAIVKLQMQLRHYLKKRGGRQQARILLCYYKALLSGRFRREMAFRICLPWLGPMAADMYLAFKRKRRHEG